MNQVRCARLDINSSDDVLWTEYGANPQEFINGNTLKQNTAY